MTSVLVVEDDRAARDMFRTALLSAGFDVVAVSDGVDALRAMETDLPGAVVLDLNLPRLSGVDVYRELRAREATRQLPVVIVTGTDAERADFPFFLRKPIHADTLSYAVENAIRETSRQPAGTGSTCPACQGTNTRKTAEARRTEIHFCSTCRKTFTVDKSPRP